MSSRDDEDRLQGLQHDLERLQVPDHEAYPGMKGAFVASLAKARYTPAIPAIASLLTHEDSYLRSEALKALLRYFTLPQYWETARRFLLEDPDSGFRLVAASVLGNLEEDTNDPRTLAKVAGVVRDETQDPLLRDQAYRAMREVPRYDAREQWTLAAKHIAEIPEVDWAWIDRCFQQGDRRTTG